MTECFCRGAKQTVHMQPDEMEAAHNPAGHRLALQPVSDSIKELPEERQIVVALVCINGMSYREAAEASGVPIDTVMSRLARVRRALHGETKE